MNIFHFFLIYILEDYVFLFSLCLNIAMNLSVQK